MATNLIWHNSADWELQPTAQPGGRGRRGIAAAAPSVIPPRFLSSRVSIADTFAAEPKAERRAIEVPYLDLSVPIEANETYALAIRHPSGALTFHFGEQVVIPGRRGARAPAATAIRFRVPIRSTGAAAERRGIVSKVVKAALLKVTGPVLDYFLPNLARAWEEASWSAKGLREGWFKVTPQTLISGALAPGAPGQPTTQRSLLLIHGTFSNAASAFKQLALTDFFSQVQAIYGERIYAFNHFTVSKTPEENARDLLAGLPSGAATFDVITHSRGGLVLRNLVERRDVLGPAASRFQLGHAVIVASPNDGTPLATPKRWDDTVGWLANLDELFPDNPFTFAASFVAEAVVWLAHRAAGGLPGIAAMDAAGKQIEDLQGPPGPPPATFSALVANYTPEPQLLLRMLDVGIDAFFGGANDLVVPSEGGWRIDRDAAAPAIGGQDIGCFGHGGNIAGPSVHHLNFFGQAETARFLAHALRREPQGLAPIDPGTALAEQRFLRGAPAAAAIPTPAAAPPGPAAPPPQLPAAAAATRPVLVGNPLAASVSDSFQLTIQKTDDDTGSGRYQIVAAYGGARVIETFETRGGEAGERFRRIISTNIRIKNHVDGKPGAKPLDDEDLIDFGRLLFTTLFSPDILRLYDVARSRERAGHLNVIFSSQVPWIADKPWEFAYDVNRNTFLATEDLHLVRNVITPVPADKLLPKAGPLRMLVAVAQPVGTGQLSAAEEETVIRRGFESLIDAGLVTVEVLRAATPNGLHRWISMGNFDIVHFIGHGVFRKPARKTKTAKSRPTAEDESEFERAGQRFDQDDAGYLVFEDERGGIQYVGFRNTREILCQRGVRLVFLNACETGQGGHGDFNRGIAPALVAAGMPAVVANQYKVLDQSATEFAQHFYWALAQGDTLGGAAREARIAVNYSIAGENIDWAVPVVYARDPDGCLCERKPLTRELMATPLVSRRARRATEAHAKRVAIWDMNHAFPDLGETVRQLNAAQTRFGFEIVDFSAPIGTWQRKSGASLQLYANVFADLLRYKPAELNADYLFCVTDRPIMYKDEKGTLHWNYDNWWPSDGGKVLVASTSIPGFPTSGPAADRAITNTLVQGLAGVMANVGTHEHGVKTCPLYMNAERDLAYTVGPETFDTRCERTLAKKIPDDFDALKRLLRIFD
ncbi:MAG TPA: CHAT domain-containing protein [Xanthobacteraceae bacterium]|nr:CHAT domain-containing protein [Xanthobacteraceae bacterium]